MTDLTTLIMVEAEIKALHDKVAEVENLHRVAVQAAEFQGRQNAKLRAALAFYGEKRNWEPPQHKAVPMSYEDHGERAREALGLTESNPLVTLQEQPSAE